MVTVKGSDTQEPEVYDAETKWLTETEMPLWLIRQYEAKLRCVCEYAWNKHEDDSEVLVTIANADIKRSDLLRLSGLNWLNDEVINAYMELLKQRNVRFLEKGEQERMHFFNTFFYARLTSGGYNYNSVRRWTMQKRIGYSLSECAKVCFGS